MYVRKTRQRRKCNYHVHIDNESRVIDEMIDLFNKHSNENLDRIVR